MTARRWLLVSAVACAWLALLLAALTSSSTWLAAVVSGLVSVATCWRDGRWASVAAGVGCVWLLAGGTSIVVAGVAGALVLAHMVLVDIAVDAHGSSALPVLAALRRLAFGAALAGAATLLVVTVGVLGGAWLHSGVGEALLLAAPLLLLSAALIALGTATRRPMWSTFTRRKKLSAVTQRYLERARLQH